jgi:hypothetical protein|tara:strand:+ start:349 stop:600 length:252 start_codon:yes stop_codon:yes gene_type:complete
MRLAREIYEAFAEVTLGHIAVAIVTILANCSAILVTSMVIWAIAQNYGTGPWIIAGAMGSAFISFSIGDGASEFASDIFGVRR